MPGWADFSSDPERSEGARRNLGSGRLHTTAILGYRSFAANGGEVVDVRLGEEEHHFSKNRGEAAVFGKVVRRRSDSNTRRRLRQGGSPNGLPFGSNDQGSPKGNVHPPIPGFFAFLVRFGRSFSCFCVLDTFSCFWDLLCLLYVCYLVCLLI